MPGELQRGPDPERTNNQSCGKVPCTVAIESFVTLSNEFRSPKRYFFTIIITHRPEFSIRIRLLIIQAMQYKKMARK